MRDLRLVIPWLGSLLVLVACVSGPSAVTGPSPHASLVLPPPTSVLPPRTLTDLIQPSLPGWWPVDLAPPKGAELTEVAGRAVWTTRDVNAAALADFFTRQGRRAGYVVYEVVESEGSIYELLFVRGATTYTTNITQGSDVTILTGKRAGTLRLTVSGATNLDLTLPMRDQLDFSPGSEISIGTSVPNPACAGCQYFINVHIAPFQGAGNYASKPAGTYIVDVELIPGGTVEKDDYRWAQSCSVQVKDRQMGSFDCRGLENVTDNTKRLDAVGTWEQPPPP